MTITPLPVETKASSGFTHKITLTTADLTTAGLTQTINLLSAPAGKVITRLGTRIITPFAVAGSVSLAANIGDTGSATRWASSLAIGSSSPTTYGISNSATSYQSADNLKIALTSASGNLNTYTVGSLIILVAMSDLTDYDLN